jgi:hypothetical protein
MPRRDAASGQELPEKLSEFKETVSREDIWFVLGLNRGRGQFLNFFAAPMIL